MVLNHKTVVTKEKHHPSNYGYFQFYDFSTEKKERQREIILFSQMQQKIRVQEIIIEEY